ncbi:MAG: glycosyltransferase, partial [Candidatus Anammoxibacter sp.]
MDTEISIVIPVYNEEGNVRPLVSSLLNVMKTIDKEYEIIL